MCGFLGLVLVLARRRQIRDAWLRALTFLLLASASGIHVGIGLVHGMYGLSVGDVTYNRLQNSYFATLTLAAVVVNVLLLLPSPPSTWKVLSIGCG